MTNHTVPAAEIRLRILATTDLHMHLMAYDYYLDRPDNSVGMVRTATLIRQAQSEAKALGMQVLLLDNGDSFQGTPLADFSACPNQPHPLVAAMEAVGYDAATLGNHDFSFGLDFLTAMVRQAKFPIFSSNVRMLKHDTWPPHVSLTRTGTDNNGHDHSINIGLIGFAPPQSLRWEKQHLAGKVRIEDIAKCAARVAGQLRAQGADLVIALAHTGIGPKQTGTQSEHAALPLAAIPGVDAIIAGHTHLHLPGTDHANIRGVDAVQGQLHGKPAIMPGANGAHLGVMDLTLERIGEGWTITGHHCELRPIAQRSGDGRMQALVGDDPEVAELFAPAHLATLRHIRQPVGTTDCPLHSYFSTVLPCSALALVAQAQGVVVRDGIAGCRVGSLPLLSAVSPSKSGGPSGPDHYTDVARGAVLLRNVADLHLFPNAVSAVQVSGREISDWLEMSAGIFFEINRETTGAQPLIDKQVPGYDFDVIYGLEYEIDLSVPARFDRHGQLRNAFARRVRNLRWNGNPIAPDQMFVVAVNSYRANGGSNFPGLDNADIVYEGGLSMQDAISRHLRQPTAALWETDTPWRFADLGGVLTTFETGPGARACLSQLAAFEPVDLGLTDQGFLQLQLKL